MIENRTLGSKIFDVINVIIMIICALLCIVPVWYVICVSPEQQGKRLMQVWYPSGRLDLTCSLTRRSLGNRISSVLSGYRSRECC